jgi:hypothetical protein
VLPAAVYKSISKRGLARIAGSRIDTSTHMSPTSDSEDGVNTGLSVRVEFHGIDVYSAFGSISMWFG